MEMSRDMTKKRKESPYMEKACDNGQKDVYISNKMQLQKYSSTFVHLNKSLLSATSLFSRSPMAYNTTASLDKLTCTDYVDFGKCQDRFGHFSWSKIDSKYLDVKLKVFKKDDNKDLRLTQKLPVGDAHFKQFMRLRNQLVKAAGNFAREESFTPVLIPTISRNMVEQRKLAHKVVDEVVRTNRKICVILLRYNVDKPENSYAQVRLFARKKEDEKFQQVVYVNYELEEFIYLVDVLISVCDKFFTNQSICNVLQNLFSSVYSLSIFFLFETR